MRLTVRAARVMPVIPVAGTCWCRFLDCFAGSGVLHIVMAWADSGDLHALLSAHAKSGKRLAEDELLGFFVQVFVRRGQGVAVRLQLTAAAAITCSLGAAHLHCRSCVGLRTFTAWACCTETSRSATSCLLARGSWWCWAILGLQRWWSCRRVRQDHANACGQWHQEHD